ncbi:MAG: phosphoribosylamine--glycine ligase [Candidatus Omnitrophica bacterium]|nr:phosphoribosylamine--glycine ligase [Candidatus Omnitrophota bacterium]MBU1995725.1 phosphoribosylamine--glycine ligase [Candidatus Omnitrophota bacterium]MBU4333689.1 phosphoribosylamine--glycine ligase [Candidatus Omnitrophota bacterium]
MKVLVIGSGGREHVLTWKISQSPLVSKIYCAPGNGGMSEMAECVDIGVNDIEALVAFAKKNDIGLTVVGPEAPLVEGIVDVFEEQGLKVFGPSKLAAQLEGSKVFSKEFMFRNNIQTAPFITFEDIDDAKEFLDNARFPIVVKADGLAAGKGVIICNDKEAAVKAVDDIMKDKIFKEAGEKIVIEECLVGEEISILAISDGDDSVILASSQDHKRIFDDDLGPNTGGMGAYSPAPIATNFLMKEIEACVIEPTIRGMRAEGIPFKGVLYAGLMVTDEGPVVLEYNVRFGDPEAQAVLPRMKNDIVELMLASCDGTIAKIELEWDSRDCVCVVMSAGGYPGNYENGFEIKGIKAAQKDGDTVVFHAGTKREGSSVVTSGGRVLGVTSLGQGIERAIENAYKAVENIKFDHCFFRRDIGAKAIRKINT